MWHTSPFLRILLSQLHQPAWRHLRRFLRDEGEPECHPSSLLCHVVSDQCAAHFVITCLSFFRHHSDFIVFWKATLYQPHGYKISAIVTSQCDCDDVEYTFHSRLWRKGCAYNARLEIHHELQYRFCLFWQFVLIGHFPDKYSRKWIIDCFWFYAVSGVFQPCYGGSNGVMVTLIMWPNNMITFINSRLDAIHFEFMNIKLGFLECFVMIYIFLYHFITGRARRRSVILYESCK